MPLKIETVNGTTTAHLTDREACRWPMRGQTAAQERVAIKREARGLAQKDGAATCVVVAYGGRVLELVPVWPNAAPELRPDPEPSGLPASAARPSEPCREPLDSPQSELEEQRLFLKALDLEIGADVQVAVIWAGGREIRRHWAPGFRLVSVNGGVARLEITEGTFEGCPVNYPLGDVRRGGKAYEDASRDGDGWGS